MRKKRKPPSFPQREDIGYVLDLTDGVTLCCKRCRWWGSVVEKQGVCEQVWMVRNKNGGGWVISPTDRGQPDSYHPHTLYNYHCCEFTPRGGI